MYAPAWVKTDLKRLRRGQIVKGENKSVRKDSWNMPYTTLSRFCDENKAADGKAFAALMRHLKEVYFENQTVIAVQVENETGLLGAAREMSDEADALFNSSVPQALMSALGSRESGLTWLQMFGDDAEEAFTAWYTAEYVEHVAKEGKKEYPLPMAVNCRLNKAGEKAGKYPSGGPIIKTREIWKAAAPSIDLYARTSTSQASATCVTNTRLRATRCLYRKAPPILMPRRGEDHCDKPKTDEEIENSYQSFLKNQGLDEKTIHPLYIPMIKGMNSNRPYIEGPWMDKHEGKYYLQYAYNGVQWNVYADGVYISNKPLGPFTLAKNNPYSYKPGGFIPGVGHDSTLTDKNENVWHSSTMRISVNHSFERRVGIWPAGWDSGGELFCNQRYGDLPVKVTEGKIDPWAAPEWYLPSKNKALTASSYTKGHEPKLAADENVRSWWMAESAKDGEWLQIDLGRSFDVRAVQINFADDAIDIPIPGEVVQNSQARFVDDILYPTRWRTALKPTKSSRRAIPTSPYSKSAKAAAPTCPSSRP